MYHVLAAAFSLFCFATQEIWSHIDPQFKVLVKKSLYHPLIPCQGCAQQTEKVKEGERPELNTFTVCRVEWKSHQQQPKKFLTKVERDQVGRHGGDLWTAGNKCGCKQLLIPSAEWNLQILRLLLWWVYATGCPVLCSKSFISCSCIMHQCHPFITNTSWHNKRLDFMQMSRDAIGELFTTVVTVALAKRSFLSATGGSIALRSVALYSLFYANFGA